MIASEEHTVREYLEARNDALWQQQLLFKRELNSLKIKLDSAKKEAPHRPAGKEPSATNTVDSRAKSTTNATPTSKSVDATSTAKSVEASRKDNRAERDSAQAN